MAVLSTNRQIHEEAASVLYSELTIVLYSGTVYDAEENIGDLSLFRTPIERIWRHDPHHGTGYTRADGSYFYHTPEMDGSLEPHVFARFKKIEWDITVSFNGYPELSGAEKF